MSKIKVIEGMEPDEVMRAHRVEGKRIAQDYKGGTDWSEIYYEPLWNWAKCDYAVIDDSQPEIDWDGFDWDFFNQYGGLRCHYGEDVKGVSILSAPDDQEDLTISESPSYHWPGGKQPVPDNVEVEGEFFDINEYCNPAGRSGVIMSAKDMQWSNPLLIAFRLTGRVWR